jgi:hypothetical protein
LAGPARLLTGHLPFPPYGESKLEAPIASRRCSGGVSVA